MTDWRQWQEENGRQLAAALAALRGRLEHLAPDKNVPTSQEPSPSGPGISPAGEGGARRAVEGDAEPFTTTEAGLKAQEGHPGQEGSSTPAPFLSPPALASLARCLGLSPFEEQILLLCVAMELDTRIAALCARAQGDPHKPFPTFALALALFDDPAWDALSPQRPLRFYRLIELHQNGVLPLTASPLRADERVVHYVKGLNYLDERLTNLCTIMEPALSPEELAASQAEVLEALLDAFERVPHAAPLPVIQLAGADAEAKQLVAREAAAQLGCTLYRVSVETLPAAPAELEALTRLWLRENRLLPLALYLDAQELDAAALDKLDSLKRFLNRTDGYAFLAVRESLPAIGQRSVAVFDVTKPTPVEQEAAWAAAIGEAAADAPAALAAQFNLNLPSIRRLASSLAPPAGEGTYEPASLAPPRGQGRGEAHSDMLDSRAPGDEPVLPGGARLRPSQLSQDSDQARQEPRPTGFMAGDPVQRQPTALLDHLWTTCCLSQRPRLDALAQRLEPKVTWDDLVLPDPETKLLRQIAAQVRHRRKVYGDWGFDRRMSRGFGISALFAGASGTGKTMAAEVLAQDLRLNLYRIDLSAVVSKYIGETEKNLRRLFDAAEDGGAILFFDEADALFGKRSEVKDSHDRYANIEINYLLQRIEAYRGLAILATNMKSALDAAFQRRLRFIVNFPYPDAADRRRLWEKVLPQPDPRHGLSGVPAESLDFDRLARFNLVGGNIQNVALNAAFSAAEAGAPVTMPLILDSIRAEFHKLDRPVNEVDFQWLRRNGGAEATATVTESIP